MTPLDHSTRPTSRLLQAGVLAFRIVLGLCLGLLGHYLLYRLALSVQPFIYVAF